jgi:hypothetical protein
MEHISQILNGHPARQVSAPWQQAAEAAHAVARAHADDPASL